MLLSFCAKLPPETWETKRERASFVAYMRKLGEGRVSLENPMEANHGVDYAERGDGALSSLIKK